MSFPVLLVLVFVCEAALHYFRWREVLQGHELPRVIAYTLGVIGLMAPFTWWLCLNTPSKPEIIRVLWSVIVAGGLSVALCYGLDWVVDMIWKVRQSSQREKAAFAAMKEVDNAQE